MKTVQSTPTTDDMEKAIDDEVASFLSDHEKLEIAIKQHQIVANDQLKKVTTNQIVWIQFLNELFS